MSDLVSPWWDRDRGEDLLAEAWRGLDCDAVLSRADVTVSRRTNGGGLQILIEIRLGEGET